MKLDNLEDDTFYLSLSDEEKTIIKDKITKQKYLSASYINDKWHGSRQSCPKCKKIRFTTCCACGCGSCYTCNYRFCCNPINIQDIEMIIN